MSTYKIANKVKGIIRSYANGPIGNQMAEYANEPFMRIEDIEAVLTFNSYDSNQAIGDKKILGYNHDTLSSIQLSRVPLSDKILSLLYIKNLEAPLFHKQAYFDSDADKKIYISIGGASKIYQVFIYNQDGVLENAYGELDISEPLEVNDADSRYSIYYSVEGTKSFYLDKPDNTYITLDLEIIGNENDNTQDMSLHIEKAVIKTNRNIYLNRNTGNTIDIIADVIYTGLDYITVE